MMSHLSWRGARAGHHHEGGDERERALRVAHLRDQQLQRHQPQHVERVEPGRVCFVADSRAEMKGEEFARLPRRD